MQAVRTVRLLRRHRPELLWVMAPPTDLVVLGLLWRRLSGGRLVVDAHSGAVVDPASGQRRPTRWLARADLVVVTTRRLAGTLTADGVRAVALHDPPLPVVGRPALPRTVLMPASWYADEPWREVLDAARLLPDVRFVLTGHPPAGIIAPANVVLTGYLSAVDYELQLCTATVVLALTTREDTMQRAAYEAVAAGRPVVASGTQALREHLTQGAVFTTGGAADLAAAVEQALADAARLAEEVTALRELHREQFAVDLARVRAAVA